MALDHVYTNNVTRKEPFCTSGEDVPLGTLPRRQKVEILAIDSHSCQRFNTSLNPLIRDVVLNGHHDSHGAEVEHC